MSQMDASMDGSQSNTMVDPLAMALNQNLENDLEELSKDKMKALLSWYLQGQEGILTQSEKLQAVLDDVVNLPPTEQPDVLKNLDVKDIIRFTVLNEFGDKLKSNATVEALVSMVNKRMKES